MTVNPDKLDNTNETAFRRGAEQVSLAKNLYIEHDALPKLRDFKGQTLDHKLAVESAVMQQLEDQLPGSSRALYKHISDLCEEEGVASQRIEGYITDILYDASEEDSPYALADIYLEDQKLCIIREPTQEKNSVDEYISSFLEKGAFTKHVSDNVARNFLLSDADMNQGVGRHEGGHCNQTIEPSDPNVPDELYARHKELDSDYEMLNNQDKSYFIDLRNLSVDHDSLQHATGVSLVSGEDPTMMHIEAAYYHENNMALMVHENYNWKGKQPEQPNYKDLSQVIQDDPKGFFKAVHEGIDQYKADVVGAHKDDPSFGTLKNVLRAEASIDYMQNFEASYRRRFLMEYIDFPEPEKLVGDGERASFYEEYDRRAQLDRDMAIEDKLDTNKVINSIFDKFDFSQYQKPDMGYEYDRYNLIRDHTDTYYEVLRNGEGILLDELTSTLEGDDTYMHIHAAAVAQKYVNELRVDEYNFRTAQGGYADEDFYHRGIMAEPEVVEYLSDDDFEVLYQEFYERKANTNEQEIAPDAPQSVLDVAAPRIPSV